MKREAVTITSLSPARPRKIISLPWDETAPVSSEATVYAGLFSREAAPVAVRLVAELLGHEQVIATGAIAPGFDGLVAVASGIVADAWHVEAYGGAPDLRLNAALGIRQCCSGFGVFVPPELQTNVPPAEGETLARVLPLGRAEGLYRVENDTADGAVALDAGDRVTRIVMTARPMADAVLTGITPTWTVVRREVGELRPNGNLQGPRTLTFTNVDHYQVEIVR